MRTFVEMSFRFYARTMEDVELRYWDVEDQINILFGSKANNKIVRENQINLPVRAEDAKKLTDRGITVLSGKDIFVGINEWIVEVPVESREEGEDALKEIQESDNLKGMVYAKVVTEFKLNLTAN